MPEWDGWGELIVDGLKLTCNMMIVGLGLACVVGLVIGAGVGVGFLTGTAGKPNPLFITLGILFGELVGIGGGLALSYFMPAIELEYLLTGSPVAVLSVGRVWRRVSVRAGDYFMLFIYTFVVQLIAQFTAILCYLPLPWAMYTQGCLVGRFIAQQRAKDAALGL
jgi:hypothetical protein